MHVNVSQFPNYIAGPDVPVSARASKLSVLHEGGARHVVLKMRPLFEAQPRRAIRSYGDGVDGARIMPQRFANFGIGHQRSETHGAVMVFSAVAVVILGIVLKLIAAEPGSVVLVPLAAIAGFYHVIVHREASRSPNPPLGLAAISDILMMSALLMQIDFSYSYNCGHTTIDGVSWIFGWSAEYRCALIRGVPAVILDASYYIPVAVTWRRLRARSRLQPS